MKRPSMRSWRRSPITLGAFGAQSQSYVAFYGQAFQASSGSTSRRVSEVEHANAWQELWAETARTQLLREFFQATTTIVSSLTIESFPRTINLQMQISDMLQAIENVFGDSESDLAKMLRVSRPMIYHYRQGMEPSDENRQRIRTLAELAREWNGFPLNLLKGLLKKEQPEGRSLLDFLSDSSLDVVALRHVVTRNAEAEDRALRNKLAAELSRRGEHTRAARYSSPAPRVWETSVCGRSKLTRQADSNSSRWKSCSTSKATRT